MASGIERRIERLQTQLQAMFHRQAAIEESRDDVDLARRIVFVIERAMRGGCSAAEFAAAERIGAILERAVIPRCRYDGPMPLGRNSHLISMR